jgi:hypothetical protein
MQSPFEIFRKHQKMLTVVLTGLAMFAFVILGAVPDPSAMPPLLGAIFIGGVVGGLAWLAGIRSKKSNEYGLIGFIAGLGIGLAAMMAVGPGDVVRADTGNINQMEMTNLQRQRGLANQFVQLAYNRAEEKARKSDLRLLQSPPRFGFGHPDETKDIVVGELLRREADKLGMQVSDDAVNDLIRSLSTAGVHPDDPEQRPLLGASDVKGIRSQMGGISESELYQALRNELKALNAGRFFYGGITVADGRNPLPPLEYWEFYRKMNIQQSLAVAPVPVSAFVDESATPGDAELQELFAAHKGNFHNTTLEGRLDEGRIGFRQPRRVALEYIEIPYDAVEKTVGEVTDEEIEQFYEENYASAPDLPAGAAGGATPTDGPMLPDMGPDDAPAADDTPQPPAEAPPADDKPAEPEADAEQPAQPPREPSDGATPQSPQTPAEPPRSEDPPSESDSEPPAEPKADDPQPAADQNGASLKSTSVLQQVAFFDDEQPTDQPTEQPAETPADNPAAADDAPAQEQPSDKPAEQTPADEKPAETPVTPQAGDAPASPAADTPQTPAADAPASEPDMPAEPAAPAEGDAPAETPATPPAEPAGPRELDDELREEIRDQILRRKTAQKQQELMGQAFELMGIELSSARMVPEDDDAYVSAADATQKLKEFARQKGLAYERTPLLTMRELQQSEEYPIGRAGSVANIQSSESAAQLAFSMAPSSLYQARQVMDIETGSRFVFWKVEDVASYVPQSLDDPGIREQVVKAWRQLQAREKARARAQELAKQADGVETPLSEIFAGATVTGKEGADAVSIVQPPKFSWLSAPSAQMSPNPFNRPMPTMTELRTVPGDVGEEFMRTVFNELDPGEAGVAHSYDMEYFYVVKVIDRSYGNSPDEQAFRERFVSQPVFDQFGFSDYFKLAAGKLAQYQTNWADELFQRHNVVFAETRSESDRES